MWRKGANGETLCNGCHLKRVGTNTRSQRQSSKESRKLVARIRAGSRKGHWNGKGGERGKDRGRRTISKMKRKVSGHSVQSGKAVTIFLNFLPWGPEVLNTLGVTSRKGKRRRIKEEPLVKSNILNLFINIPYVKIIVIYLALHVNQSEMRFKF
jgi:hypothetical protein